MENLLSTSQLSKEMVLELLQLADQYYELAKGKGYSNELEGKIMAALFYEPSTRTRLSTETAMLRLGGRVITAVGEEYSSLRKGETLGDTARVISNYADVVAIRHSKPGSAKEFAEGASVPVINCGDGPADHPTQALLEAYELYRNFGKLDGLTIAYIGDLKNSRTSNALLKLLSNFGGKAKLLSPPSLKLVEDSKYEGIEYEECESIEQALEGVDAIYSSRVRVEYFEDQSEYEKLKDYFVLTRDLLESNCPEALLLHALPRIDEIPEEVDDWKGARYFKALPGGVAVRMALLKKLLCT